ncbi:diguanylate cyclase [Paenalkalicoccus suaedae]|uniref:Diguanylate cyclase n=1 Tax=Paenalkalicoccus suaedae TaxID=2592382 RepID=A0A859FJ60_9BACI|nr:diguanylate cyclase [Paenalkalicoccus suaedae]QKS72902.1 diguanylate cyclase [Paenalkalicoccus suaedae]
MDKYRNMLRKRIHSILSTWQQQQTVTGEELYRFYHNIKGTAGTIGMHDVQHIAERELEVYVNQKEEAFSREDWQPIMNDLLFFFEDAVEKEDESTKEDFSEDLPLVLIVDDDIEFGSFLKDKLENNGYQALLALSGKKGIDLFYDMSPRLILLDYLLPDVDGMEVLKQILKKSMREFIPVIMLSAYGSEDRRNRALELGAMDFIDKPLIGEGLLPLINNRMRFQHRIISSIMNDELTGVYNRRFLMQEIKRSVSRLERKSIAPFSIVLCDLDYFKKVNDTYGHSIGDKVLRAFATSFKDVARSEDIISRYGGEEFVLLLPNTSASDALKVTNRWRDVLESRPVTTESGDITIRFSAGVREVREVTHHEEILKEADFALYAAKAQGRNKSLIYDEELMMEVANSPIHIIVVDDDEVVGAVFAEHFKQKKQIANREVIFHSYITGESFLEADWYEENGYYFLLLDGMLPDLDGVEILQRVRATYPKDKILISMLTARSEEEEIERALNLGADDYMVKPFRIKELGARIEGLVERVYTR